MSMRTFLKKCWYFFWGKIFCFILYQKNYRTSAVFQGRLFGINLTIWEYVVRDMKGRLFLNRNRGVPFLCSPNIKIANYENIEFDPDDLYNFLSDGSYYQAMDAKIKIGKGTCIANNVGLITSYHNFYHLQKRGKTGNIVLGNDCWIGMNALVLAGVALGEHTIVGGGSVVTKSFTEGWCVIAGNPAKVIKKLEKPLDECAVENCTKVLS